MVYLAINIFNGRNVMIAKGIVDESKDERRFTDGRGPQDNNPVIVVLFRFVALLEEWTMDVIPSDLSQCVKVHDELFASIKCMKKMDR